MTLNVSDGRDTVLTSLRLQPQQGQTDIGRSPVYLCNNPQTIAMADAAVTLNMTDGATNQLTSNILFVDPASAGGVENLLLPPEADCPGLFLFITNTGEENIALQNDAGGALCTIPAGESASAFCNGTTWKAGVLASGGSVTKGVSFVEDGSETSYVATVEIPAGAIIEDIGFVTTVLWDGTSASLIVGDDIDDNGWFAATNLKATDLVVGEVYSITNSENWGGKQGAYLVAATGRKGPTTAGVDSGVYIGAAAEVIFKVTPGAADGSAGRSFGWVRYSVPNFVASTNT